ncbi:MAG: DUF4149 domain-containing protein [Acidobacteriota bacterium]
MLVLRYLYAVALVLWLGGTLVAGAIVAPATFEVLQAWDPAVGRMLAGQLFGDILARLHVLGYAAGGVMMVSLTVQRLVGPRPVAYGIRAALTGVMLALFGYSGWLVLPRVQALQREIGGPVNALPADDTRRVEFDALHERSTQLVTAASVVGLVLLVWEARERQ